MPFRYQDIDDDLNDDLRKYYFGRKTDEEAGKIAYYFKAFETTPMLHLRYTDGTQITDEMYNVETEQGAECYVETKLRITRNDFRDYTLEYKDLHICDRAYFYNEKNIPPFW